LGAGSALRQSLGEGFRGPRRLPALASRRNKSLELRDLHSSGDCANVQYMNDHLAAPQREFLDLYAKKYPQIRFADLDLSVLEAAAEEVAAAAAKVAAAEAEIVLLREQMKMLEGAMTQKVVRGLAFLKVYLAGDEEECARLEALTQALRSSRNSDRSCGLGTAARSERRRGRPAKSMPAATAPSDVAGLGPVAEDFADEGLPSPALGEFDRDVG
jgi:hypothetical protein